MTTTFAPQSILLSVLLLLITRQRTRTIYIYPQSLGPFDLSKYTGCTYTGDILEAGSMSCDGGHKWSCVGVDSNGKDAITAKCGTDNYYLQVSCAYN